MAWNEGWGSEGTTASGKDKDREVECDEDRKGTVIKGNEGRYRKEKRMMVNRDDSRTYLHWQSLRELERKCNEAKGRGAVRQKGLEKE